MGSTVQLAGLVGVSSPPLASQVTAQRRRQEVGLLTPRAAAAESTPPPRRPRRRGGRARRIGAAGAPEEKVEEPSVDFEFVSLMQPRLLPDGTPDVPYRTARGGQKLRNIMLEGYIDLYGPYDKFLLNCSSAQDGRVWDLHRRDGHSAIARVEDTRWDK